MPKTVVVAGAGHAAGQLVASLRQGGFGGDIVLFGDEPYLPYQRPPLSKKFLAGELDEERLHFKAPSFYAQERVEACLDSRITAIEPEAHRVVDAAGNARSYDQLVLATGSRVRPMSVPGVKLAGVHYLRTIADVNAIRADIEGAKRLVVVGAGYIGLEVAAVCRQRGLDVTVVEMADRVMSRVVSPQVSDFYADQHRQRGVRLALATGVSGFEGTGGRVASVVTADGERLPADAVVIGIGIEPNTELAADSGLAVDNGIRVDEHCITSDPDIYAVGDCTSHPSAHYGRRVRLESVHNALEQAKTAAANLCGEDAAYRQIPWFWSDQYDLKLQIAGLSDGYDTAVIRGDPASRQFSCLYLGNGRLLAVDAINSPRDFVQSKPLIDAGAAIDPARLTDTGVLLKDML